MPLGRPLRVFHVIANPTWGGITRLLAALIPHADRTRVDMRVVNMATHSPVYDTWDRLGIHCYRLPTPGRFPLSSVPGLARLLRRERPDVVEIYGLRANIIGRLAARLAGVPVVLTGVISTDDWRRRHHVMLDRLTRWAVTGWVANARACRQSLVDRERHPADRIEVIYDGIETDLWEPVDDPRLRAAVRREWGWREDAVVGITVAGLKPDKGVQYLIEAAAEVVRSVPAARFLIVGSDGMNGRLHRQARDRGLQDVVVFAGFQEDVRRLYGACDLAVLPSLREGLPLFLVEAMCMRLPVVATTVSGTPELVDVPRTGLLVPPRDPVGLAEALAAVMGDARRRAEMGEAARARVLEAFRIERMAAQRQELYERLVDAAGRRA